MDRNIKLRIVTADQIEKLRHDDIEEMDEE